MRATTSVCRQGAGLRSGLGLHTSFTVTSSHGHERASQPTGCRLEGGAAACARMPKSPAIQQHHHNKSHACGQQPQSANRVQACAPAWACTPASLSRAAVLMSVHLSLPAGCRLEGGRELQASSGQRAQHTCLAWKAQLHSSRLDPAHDELQPGCDGPGPAKVQVLRNNFKATAWAGAGWSAPGLTQEHGLGFRV